MTDSTRKTRRPTAFQPEDTRVRFAIPPIEDQPASDALPDELDAIGTDADITPAPTSKGFSFSKWIAIGVTGLVGLAFGLAIDSLIRDLFTRYEWLGWFGLALAALAVIGILGLTIKEYLGIRRVAVIDHLRDDLQEAADENDERKARENLKSLIALYQDVPETARGRKILTDHMSEVIDGRDLIILAERDLMRSLDRQAQQIVMSSAKRVSLITAVSPRALFDLLAVLFENLRTIRKLSALYGGRPGTFGFLRLIRHIGTHLAITGGMAAGESLASQVLGHGLAARLSARLGEGLLNGILTARIGIAAIAVCRPVPYIDTNGPKLSNFASELVKTTEKVEDPKA